MRSICEKRAAKLDPEALNHIESAGAQAIVKATNNILRKTDTGVILDRLWKLESLVLTFIHFEASDPRDTIFALLSLAKDNFNIGDPSKDLVDSTTIPDYTSTPLDVYMNFVAHCVISTGSVDIVCRHWALPFDTARGSFSEETASDTGPVTCKQIDPGTGKPCNIVFLRPLDLSRHENTIHNFRRRNFKCSLCIKERTFSRNDALIRHMRVVHPEVKYGAPQADVNKSWVGNSSQSQPPRLLKNASPPTWIGQVADPAFGPPLRFTGRINGDSFVGEPGSKTYNASRREHNPVSAVVFPMVGSQTLSVSGIILGRDRRRLLALLTAI